LFHDNTWAIFKGPDGQSPLRPFKSREEMHTTIILCHNSVVGVNDYVYFLGDLTFKYGPEFDAVMHQLNGSKRYVPGNHCDLKQMAKHMHHFKKAKGVWYAGEGDDDGCFPFTMSHVPLLKSQIRWGEHNAHGHTHAYHMMMPHPYLKDKEVIDPAYHNVCVEPRAYVPVNFDTIHEEIKQRES
jgi:calcineurin-like phosphoesterase family protein